MSKGKVGSLGRRVEFDDRSRRYMVRPRLYGAVTSKKWSRRIYPFDQGSIGSCTGQGAVGLLATAPFRRVDEKVNEPLARKVYSQATKRDPWPGEWPPDDTGSSVLAAMKALKALGWCKRYDWCFGLTDVLLTLSQVGPVEIGVNWYDGFDQPDAQGRVKITGGIRGGHAFELLAVDAAREDVIGINSWGTSWGVRGRFRFSWAVLDRLLREDGEASTIVR